VPFDAVLTSEEAGYYKPQPVPYAAILSALGVDASDTLFVAGSSADVPGATEAGMKVVWHNRVNLAPISNSISPLREGRTLDEALHGFI